MKKFNDIEKSNFFIYLLIHMLFLNIFQGPKMKQIIIVLSVLTVATCHPYTNYMGPAYHLQNAQQQPENKAFLQVDTPEVFASTPSPLLNSNKSPEYTDFLKHLYRFDHDKSQTTFLVEQHHNQNPTQSYVQQHPQAFIQPSQYNPNNPIYYQGTQSPHSISKRAIIFRPLFVYRKQQIKKQKVQEQQAQGSGIYSETIAPQPTRRPSPSLYYGSNYPAYGQKPYSK